MTEKAKTKIIEPFDYSEVNQDHQDAIREVLEIIKTHDLSNTKFEEEILRKFNFEQPNVYNIEDNSIFVQAARHAGINVMNQGQLKQSNTLYPIIAVQDDTRKLDDIIRSAITIYEELKHK